MKRLRWLVARLYVGLWLFRLKALLGWMSLLFFRVVYPGFSVGRHARIWGRFKLMMFANSRVVIGDNLHMVSSPDRSGITLFSRCSFTTYPGGEIRIGNRVGLNGTTITSKKLVQIGDGTMIAPNVIIVDSDFHAQWPPDARLISSTAETDREVTIGDNSIIGALSLVTGDIPANVVAGGNPARVLRPLGAQGPTGTLVAPEAHSNRIQ
jgi:acetyltransferase-like isoleucine patch superfamily enzyme